jgi:6-phosphogluconolactonase
MSFNLSHSPDAAALAKTVAAEWLGQLQAHLGKPGDSPYTVALSGGRITRTFFTEIVRQVADSGGGFQNILPRVHFFWADERCVPPGDPESNYAMARELLFEPLKIAESRIHRLRGEGPELVALREAINDICSIAPKSNGQPVFDLIFLGMGEDGHVASLFPGEPEAAVADPAIYRAVTAVKPPPRRITLGYGAIAAAVDVWVLASGTGKEAALKESLSPAGKTPLARVLRQRAQTRIFTEITPH